MKQYSARTLEELLQKAAADKSVDQEDLVYYIKEEKSGFLGIGARVSAEVFAPLDVKNFVSEYLSSFFESLGLEVEQSIEVDKNRVIVNLNAENNAILIGRNGSSLNGMRNLLRNAVSSKFKRRFFVDLDINDYKKNRYEKLINMAHRLGRNVQKTKIDVSLDPMPNDERRIIHKELASYPNIKTKSEGKGRQRHLKIVYVED